jgi:hypothetical protein
LRATAAAPAAPSASRRAAIQRRQRLRRRLTQRRQAELAGKLAERGGMQIMRRRAEQAQRVGGGFRVDERMAVAVAADPVAEDHQRPGAAVGAQRRVEARALPGRAEAALDPGQHVGEHLRQIMQHIGALIGHRGLLQEDLAGAPEPLDGGADLGFERRALRRRPHRVLELDQQAVERAVMRQHGAPLGLGGMRRQHRLDADGAQRLRDLLCAEPRGLELREALVPGPGLARQSAPRLGAAPALRRGVLLGLVEELEGDGIGLRAPLVQRRGGGGAPSPRQRSRQGSASACARSPASSSTSAKARIRRVSVWRILAASRGACMRSGSISRVSLTKG